MNLNLDGKTAVIFGASSGIGACCAAQFAGEGAVVYGVARRGGLMEDVCREINAKGGTAHPLTADISKETDITEALESVRENSANGRIDILVNCAAIAAQQLDITDKIELFRTIIDVNLVGIYNVCRYAIPLIAGGGSIVNFSSLAAYVAGVGGDNYTAAKAGISGLTRALAAELAPDKIRVNAVCPGFVDTPMTEVAHPAARAGIIEGIPLKRAGRPEDIANVVLFLSSERASFITGQVIHINGGQYMA